MDRCGDSDGEPKPVRGVAPAETADEIGRGRLASCRQSNAVQFSDTQQNPINFRLVDFGRESSTFFLKGRDED